MMNVLLTLPLPGWASALTALGWLYCAWAVGWPRLFYSDILRHAQRENLGYRLGRAIYWQLPRRPTLLIAAGSLLPWLVLLLGPGLIAPIILGLATAAFSLLWLTQPPGQRLGIIEESPLIFKVRAASNPLRTGGIFILCGMIPAMLMGACVHMLVSAWAG